MRSSRMGVGSVLLALAAATLGDHAAAAPPAAAAVKAVLDGLLATEPATRVETVRRLGGSWTEGPDWASVLTDVALEDGDAGVRAAARAAVESLAERALDVWRDTLEAVRKKPGAHENLAEVGRDLSRMGHHLKAVDLAAGVAASRTDAERADTLAAFPIALAAQTDTQAYTLVGFEALFAGVRDGTGEAARAIAAANLVLLACARLRDATDGAPSPAPETTRDLATWRTLLFVEGQEALTEVATTVLGSLGRPGMDLLLTEEALTSLVAFWPRQGRALEALGSQLPLDGPPDLQLVRAPIRRRIGPYEGLLPALPPPGAAAEVEETFAWVCAELALAAPEVVRPAEAALARLAAKTFGPSALFEGPSADEQALLALARLGSLTDEGARRTLLEIAGGTEPRAVLARLALVRGTAARRETLGRLAFDLQRMQAHHEREVHRVLPSLAAKLEPVRTTLEDLLKTPDVRLDRALVVARTVGRMESADAATCDILRALLATRPELRPAPRAPTSKQIDDSILELAGQMEHGPGGRRLLVDALGAMGRRARAAIPDLEALRGDADLGLRWRVERALAALRAP